MNNRLVNIDKLKAIATILVVFIHSYNIIGYSGLQDYRNPFVEKYAVISNIAVPIFFFLLSVSSLQEGFRMEKQYT